MTIILVHRTILRYETPLNQPIATHSKLIEMKFHRNLFAAILFFLLIFPKLIYATSHCSQLFESRELIAISDHSQTQITPQITQITRITKQELITRVSEQISKVIEFDYIRSLAKNMGIRVWLFGGTASSFIHYIRWDIAAHKGLTDLLMDRFDYDFSSIFRSTQDIDLVVDAPPETARRFQDMIANRFPHFLGERATKWEVRTLRSRIGRPGEPQFKEALINDSDFQDQNTDSHSVGMIEVSDPGNDPIIRDLRNWNQSQNIFLEDALHQEITFFRSDRHFQTSRAIAGENPEILSALRILVKAFQYELVIPRSDFEQIRKISNQFDPRQISNTIAKKRIQDTSKKLIIHAVNLEYAFNVLDELGLRQKLISMGDSKHQGDFAWWLNREPLRSKPVGQGFGPTAKEINLPEVIHEASGALAMESIMRAHSGAPNVLISRKGGHAERAAFGDGFYTSTRSTSYRGSGIYIRFAVNPNAREGTDFIFLNQDIIVFKNKNALRIIPESFEIDLNDILNLAETRTNLAINKSDRGLIEQHLRRFTTAKIMKELDRLFYSDSEFDLNQLIRILRALYHTKTSSIISKKVRDSIAKNIFQQTEPLRDSKNESIRMKYIQIVQSIIKQLDFLNLLKTSKWIEYLKENAQNSNASFQFRATSLRSLLFTDSYQIHSYFTQILKTFDLENSIQIINELIDHPRHKNLIQRDLPALIVLVRSRPQIRNRLIEMYENHLFKPIQPLVEKVLDTPDLSNENVANFIERLSQVQKTRMMARVFDIDEIFQLHKTLKDTSIENSFAKELIGLYEPSHINGEIALARTISKCLYSPQKIFQEFGRKLLQNENFSNLDSLKSFHQIFSMQNTDDFKQAALAWMNSPQADINSKINFLLPHFGTPYFRIYQDAIHPSQLLAFKQKLNQRANIALFQGLTSEENILGAKPESFIFQLLEFPPGGKQVLLGNPLRDCNQGSMGDFCSHLVIFKESFEIQATPVTQLQWSIVMGNNPSQLKTGGHSIIIQNQKVLLHPNRPVENVSWEDAQHFIDQLNQLDPDYHYRLPTEDEWEYAARAGTETRYSFGDDPKEINSFAWHSGNAENETHDVASLRPNAGGLYDVHGNVWEWTENPTDLPNSYRIARGDDYLGNPHLGMRTTYRNLFGKDVYKSTIGFRLVRIPKDSSTNSIKTIK